jgi:hypothetical protein
VFIHGFSGLNAAGQGAQCAFGGAESRKLQDYNIREKQGILGVNVQPIQPIIAPSYILDRTFSTVVAPNQRFCKNSGLAAIAEIKGQCHQKYGPERYTDR